ncbi:MAG: hypothetical protein WBD98_02835, partial [Acidobacteriaceae bacterium]
MGQIGDIAAPHGQEDRHGEGFGVADDAGDHGGTDQQRAVMAGKGRDDGNSHEQAPGFRQPGVVAGRCPEFGEVEGESGGFGGKDCANQAGIAVPDLRLADPEGDGDAEIEEGVGHGIEEADAGGIALPAAGEDAVEDVRKERAENERGEGGAAPVAALAG